MKLAKKDRLTLERILSELERGQKYIMDERTIVAKKCDYSTTTEHLTNSAGLICYPVDKDIGSELALLNTGIHNLRALLFDND